MAEFLIPFLVAMMTWLICFRCRRAGQEHLRPDARPLGRIISDEEFLAACSIQDPRIAFNVRRIISDCSGVDENLIHPRDRLVTDLFME